MFLQRSSIRALLSASRVLVAVGAVWLCVVSILRAESPAGELFALPAVDTAGAPRVASLNRLPLDCGPKECRRNALFPSSLGSPYETPLFCYPHIDRQIIGPPLFCPPPAHQCLPPSMPPPSAPGYLRGPTRYGITAPVPPSVVSAHAPPWEQMPPPAELGGGVMVPHPHQADCRASDSQFNSGDFTPDPFYDYYGWDAGAELNVYGGKYFNRVQRPALEWGLPLYLNGPIPRSGTFLGPTNLVQPKFYVYGDFRTAIAQNKNIADEQTIWASRLNLEIDFWLTATERFHMFWGPLDKRNQFTNVTFDGGEVEYNDFFDGWDERTDTM